MQPKSEQFIFPNAVPLPPEDYKGFQAWARTVTLSHNELNKQIFNLYNRHLSDALAHPSMWKANRIQRHACRNNEDNGSTVLFPISVFNPLHVVTGETRQVNQPRGYKLLFATEDIIMNFNINGPGGLDTGFLDSGKAYYIYGINNNDTASLIASLNDPSVGPIGYNYGEWMYQCAVATYVTGSFPQFVCSRGMFVTYSSSLETRNHTGTNASTLMTFAMIPVTAKFALIGMDVQGTAGTFGRINGMLGQFSQGAQRNHAGPSIVALVAPQTISAQVSTAATSMDVAVYGWIEDTSEFS